jgi:hypothetical protein
MNDSGDRQAPAASSWSSSRRTAIIVPEGNQ